MCLNPLLIPNKNFHNGVNYINRYSFLSDTTSLYLKVPCGNCAECRHLKQLYLTQRVEQQAVGHYCFFVTLTYDNKHLPITMVDGREYQYVDRSHIQKMFKRLSKESDFHVDKYLYVTEYGGFRHRPHVHMLLFVPKSPSDDIFSPLMEEKTLERLLKKHWSINIGTNRKPVYEPLFTDVCRHTRYGLKRPFSCEYVKQTDETNVSFYVTKYLLKYDTWLEKVRFGLYKRLDIEEYKRVWKLLKPICEYSNYFGITDKTAEHIRFGIDHSVDHPLYINSKGNVQPLCKYYWNKFGRIEDKVRFYFSKHDDVDSSVDLVSSLMKFYQQSKSYTPTLKFSLNKLIKMQSELPPDYNDEPFDYSNYQYRKDRLSHIDRTIESKHTFDYYEV